MCIHIILDCSLGVFAWKLSWPVLWRCVLGGLIDFLGWLGGYTEEEKEERRS